ncbi:MAG: hypothetical protein V3T14_05340, partial [Myxococcota bacterium]
VEPGLRVGDLLEFAIGRGWYPPVLPGHPMITIGGCIGCNVHGKSQYHGGTFVDCVESLQLFHPEHGETTCSPESDSDLFELTVGGLGLTGFVTSVDLRLTPLKGRSVLRKRVPVRNLIEAVETMEDRAPEADSLYSWHDLNRRGDSFGRGVVYVERFAWDPIDGEPRFRSLSSETRSQLPVPLFNRVSAALFTHVYGRLESMLGSESRLDLKTAAFPINGREIYFALFGTRGFREYQMLVPRDAWDPVVADVERLLEAHRISATLGSLKLFRGRGTLLNFCGSGICLTIDVPATGRALSLFGALDDLVLRVGGIVNVWKDSRLSGDFLRRLFPDYGQFQSRLRDLDPKRRFDSALRRRILV